MQRTMRVSIPFTATSVSKCMCPECPVQGKSKCASGKLATVKDTLKASALKREDIPGVYCSTGTATCRDTDTKQSCICGSCAIFGEYKLANFKLTGYYCRDGSTK